MHNGSQDFMQAFQRAMLDPRQFTQQMSQSNPLAYQQALQIANSQNPKAAIIQLAQQKGVPSNIIQMLGGRQVLSSVGAQAGFDINIILQEEIL